MFCCVFFFLFHIYLFFSLMVEKSFDIRNQLSSNENAQTLFHTHTHTNIHINTANRCKHYKESLKQTLFALHGPHSKSLQ